MKPSSSCRARVRASGRDRDAPISTTPARRSIPRRSSAGRGPPVQRRVRQPAFGERRVAGEHGGASIPPARSRFSCSTQIRPSTTSSSRRTPAAPSAFSPRRFRFAPGSRLVMTADNHNSVNGLRVAARQRRAAVEYVPLDAELRGLDPRPWLSRTPGAFALCVPAQSNFSGVRHPLEWVRDAQQRGYRVLLDAAAFAATSPLSLSDVPADFVADLVLQAVRLSDRRRRAGRATRGARDAAASIFRRRHRAVRFGPEPPLPRQARCRGVRGRHAQFSGDACGLRRIALARGHRDARRSSGASAS